MAAFLPAPVAAHEVVLALIETEGLFGSGIGYVDAHLLASAKLSGDAELWTRDRRLTAAARRLGISVPPTSFWGRILIDRFLLRLNLSSARSGATGARYGRVRLQSQP